LCAEYAAVNPILKKDGSGPCRLPSSLTATAFRKLVNIIAPTPEKFLQQPKRFLGYGMIGWSNRIPRIQMDYDDSAPLLNLTPPKIFEQTGMALVVRGYSHIERFDPRWNVAVGAERWFDTGFFSVTDLHAVSIKGRIAGRCGKNPILAGARAMKGFSKKEVGAFDREVFEEICRRYSAEKGRIPGFITVHRQQPRSHHR